MARRRLVTKSQPAAAGQAGGQKVGALRHSGPLPRSGGAANDLRKIPRVRYVQGENQTFIPGNGFVRRRLADRDGSLGNANFLGGVQHFDIRLS
ncbi:hypothetical protein RZS08_50960, partial [Arthrospira platensis SPKY1]|nr:hypothetical protein [Arthrospira platensis SPKY1]